MKYIPLESIIEFLTDEGISPRVGSTDPEKYHMSFNDPFVDDSKHRCGIARIFVESTGEYETVFNGFKSSALLGDDFHGSFYKFVKLLKNFNTIHDAIEYFDNKYIYPNFSAQDLLHWNVLSNNNDIDEKLKQYVVLNQEGVYFPNSFERLDITKREHWKYTKYFINRKIAIKTIKNNVIFVDNYTSRLVFPVYENNKLVFYTKRSINPHDEFKWIKLKNSKKVFPIWNLDNAKLEVIIFEGIFDAIHFNNGVALFGSFWNESLRAKILSKHFFKIIVAMDNDKPGRAAKLKIAEDLSHYHENVYVYNYKGITYKDFGEIIEHDGKFEENRVIKWDYAAKVKFKMGVYV